MAEIVDGQGAVLALQAGGDELVLSAVGIGNGERAINAEMSLVKVFVLGHSARGRAANDCLVVGAVNGDGHLLLGAIDRVYKQGFGKRLASFQALNRRL
ncbi:hypothetical protein SHAQ108633_03115 [Shewanella aquimarina]